MGPAWGLQNYWLAEGFSFGITAAGGAGWQLADWIVEGEPDDRHAGTSTRAASAPTPTRAIRKLKNEEAYEHVFVIHYPLEERPAGAAGQDRALLRPPEGAGRRVRAEVRLGAANWFAPKGTRAKDKYSFRRTNFFEPVREECRAVRERVGLLDLTGFSKFEVSGPGAEALLDGLVANRIPKKIGRIHARPCADPDRRRAHRVHHHARRARSAST